MLRICVQFASHLFVDNFSDSVRDALIGGIGGIGAIGGTLSIDDCTINSMILNALPPSTGVDNSYNSTSSFFECLNVMCQVCELQLQIMLSSLSHALLSPLLVQTVFTFFAQVHLGLYS